MNSRALGNLRIDGDRLMDRIFRLGRVGALEGGGVQRPGRTPGR